jgi:hypothetical protein
MIAGADIYSGKVLFQLCQKIRAQLTAKAEVDVTEARALLEEVLKEQDRWAPWKCSRHIFLTTFPPLGPPLPPRVDVTRY